MTGANVARRRRRRRRNGGSNGRGPAGGRRGRRLLAVLAPLSVLLVLAGLIGAIAAAFYGINRYNEFIATVVPPEELLAQLPRGGARIYDRNGTLLYEFFDDAGGLRRPVPLSDISPALIDATVATEDSDFWENNGLNTRGLVRAAWENVSPFGGSLFEGSGGSSITQQLAKNVYIPREERAKRSVERKLKEAAIALELTNQYSKEQILEWYLNSISYGGIYTGIEAASEGYFGKSAAELTLAESALLAGIPQRPRDYEPFNNRLVAFARQSQVLDLMVRREMITPSQADDAREEEIEFRTGHFDIDAAHFVLGRVAREIEQHFGERALYEDGLEVITTIDIELQHEAERILDGWIREFEDTSDGHNGAFFALDPLTGQILVYVGSRDYFREDIEGHNDNIISLNSPGSTLKPFTYMTAFMQGWSTGTGILDTPIKVIDAATGEFFSPRNPGTGYQGVITAEKALGNSLNIPAFKTILFAGVDNVVSVLKEAGFTTLDNPLGYGPALSLGGVDITLEDLTYGYSVFATGGVMRGQQALAAYDPGERTIDPVVLLRVTDADGETLYEFTEPTERRVFASNFTYLATSILSNGDNQCITFRVCGALGLPGRASAQKTGTSEPFEDSRGIGETWAVGYTPQLVAGVWAGNSDNSPMVNIVSTSISWRTWRDFMIFAHERLELPPRQFERPPGLVERELCWPSGRLPSDLCPQVRRYEGLFAEDAIPSDGEALEELVDDWWQLVRIDTRTGLLAAPTTPAAFVAEEVRLVLPIEEIEEWEGLDEWAARLGLTSLLAPSEESSTVGALVRISSPAATATLNDTVTLIGRAASPGFRRYAIEWGRGANPLSWVRIKTSSRAVPNGVLGTWNTLLVPNGDYTLRVVVQDAERGELRFAIPVSVDNGDRGATADLAPFATISAPPAGSVVSGAINVTGTAISGATIDVVVEVGAGINPQEWTRITRSTQPLFSAKLAQWDTTLVEDGAYTLRVTVRDRTLGSAEATVVVIVKNEGG